MSGNVVSHPSVRMTRRHMFSLGAAAIGTALLTACGAVPAAPAAPATKEAPKAEAPTPAPAAPKPAAKAITLRYQTWEDIVAAESTYGKVYRALQGL
jgi:hypothetical protein